MTKKCIKKEKVTQLSFSFDSLEILGVFGNKVYIRGFYFSQIKDDMIDCVLEFKNKLFKKSLNLWLKDKKDYCERWGHFCGVMGSIRSDNFEEIGSVIFDDEKKELRTFKINSIEEFCDMEHG